MKIFIVILYCYIFCFFGICEKEEKCEETKWKPAVKYNVYVILVDSQDGPNCTKKHTVEFKKYHCGGGLSGAMSYEFQGCDSVWEEGELTTWFNKVGIGYWDTTIDNDDDELFFYVKEGSNLLFTFTVDTKMIKSKAKKDRITVEIHIPGGWWVLH